MNRIRRCALSALLCAAALTAGAEVHYRGVNLSGAEFGSKQKIPGTFGTDYIYPGRRDADYFLGLGMNTFRIPFKWERLQPALQQPLDSAELARLDQLVSHIVDSGAYALLDLHNYSRYQGRLVGSEVPREALADIWSRLAEHYRDQPRVLFGLMNEPHSMPTDHWVANANAALAAIRAAGARNLVLVPGNAWSGAHSWHAERSGGSNAEAMQHLLDPGENYLIEAHQYLDSDSSGTRADCVSPEQAQRRLTGFTQWLREHGERGFLGEFGGGRSEECLAAITALLAHVEENGDVWAGWTYWSAGPWWGDYHSTLSPTADGTERPQLAPLRRFLPSPE